MNYSQPTPLSGQNANTEWTIEAARELARPRDELRDRIAPALSAALRADVINDSFYAWRSELSLPKCLFDACRVEASLSEIEGRAACAMRIAFRFESTEMRLNQVLWLGMTLVGLPVAYAWRSVSIRQAKGYADRSLDALWAGLAEVDRHDVYR